MPGFGLITEIMLWYMAGLRWESPLLDIDFWGFAFHFPL